MTGLQLPLPNCQKDQFYYIMHQSYTLDKDMSQATTQQPAKVSQERDQKTACESPFPDGPPSATTKDHNITKELMVDHVVSPEQLHSRVWVSTHSIKHNYKVLSSG